MKKIVFAFVTLILIAGAAFAADPVEGYWLSVDDKTGKATGSWQIYVEGQTLRGKMLGIAGFDQSLLADQCTREKDYRDKGFPIQGTVSGMPVVGTTWIWGLSSKKEGEWSDGRIIDPNDGKMYQCKITFRKADGKKYKVDTLEMRGEIGLGIGRSQFWVKTTEAEARAIR
jgi:uncharacterized protein (DUF2147 family)